MRSGRRGRGLRGSCLGFGPRVLFGPVWACGFGRSCRGGFALGEDGCGATSALASRAVRSALALPARERGTLAAWHRHHLVSLSLRSAMRSLWHAFAAPLPSPTHLLRQDRRWGWTSREGTRTQSGSRPKERHRRSEGTLQRHSYCPQLPPRTLYSASKSSSSSPVIGNLTPLSFLLHLLTAQTPATQTIAPIIPIQKSTLNDFQTKWTSFQWCCRSPISTGQCVPSELEPEEGEEGVGLEETMPKRVVRAEGEREVRMTRWGCGSFGSASICDLTRLSTHSFISSTTNPSTRGTHLDDLHRLVEPLPPP